MELSIKVLTYNIFLRPPPIKTNEDDYKNERMADFIGHLPHYDIICLQEMFQTASFRVEELIVAAIEVGFHYWKTCESPSIGPGPVVDSGLVVLSKYPIEVAHFESYNIGILSDSASDKGFIYCRIRVKQAILHLFTTHLQASYMHPNQDRQRELSIKTRQHQCTILASKINACLKQYDYSPVDCILLAGDLNINSRQRIIRRQSSLISSRQMRPQNPFSEYIEFKAILSKAELSFLDLAEMRYKEHPVTFGDGDRVLTSAEEAESYQRLDYILSIHKVSEGDKSKSLLKVLPMTCTVEKFAVQGKKYSFLSDHYGISVELSLK